MYTFRVSDMTCGHCEKAIRNEIEDLDAQAQVSVDLNSKEVSVQSQQSLESVQKAIEEAGYTPELLS